MKAFEPQTHYSLSVSTTSASQSIYAGAEMVRLYNSTTGTVFVRWGSGAQTAVTTDMALAPGGVEVFDKGAASTLAAIMSSGSGTLYISVGSGV
jgi:hypothetical protein